MEIECIDQQWKTKLTDFANGHKYYGLHKTTRGWVFREWAPNATAIYLVGDFNNWEENDKYKAKRIDEAGNWELKLPTKAMKHGDLFKMHVYWNGGMGERIPAWATRVVQDEETKYSRHRCGTQSHTNGRRRHSNRTSRHCSSTSVI